MENNLTSLKSPDYEGVDKLVGRIESSKKKATDLAYDQADTFQNKADTADEGFRDNVSKGFEAKRGAWDNVAIGAQKNYDTGIGSLTDRAQSSRDSIERNKQGGFEELDHLKGKTIQQHKKGLQSLQQDMRNAFQAGNTYLGSAGANDSSASGMYSTALQQSANRGNAELESTVSQNLNDLSMERSRMEREANQQLADVDAWLNEGIADLKMQFNSQMAEIEAAKANATGDEYLAIADYEKQLQRDFQMKADEMIGQAITWEGNVEMELASLDTEINRIKESLDTGYENAYSNLENIRRSSYPVSTPQQSSQVAPVVAPAESPQMSMQVPQKLYPAWENFNKNPSAETIKDLYQAEQRLFNG